MMSLNVQKEMNIYYDLPIDILYKVDKIVHNSHMDLLHDELKNKIDIFISNKIIESIENSQTTIDCIDMFMQWSFPDLNAIETRKYTDGFYQEIKDLDYQQFTSLMYRKMTGDILTDYGIDCEVPFQVHMFTFILKYKYLYDKNQIMNLIRTDESFGDIYDWPDEVFVSL